MGRRMPKSLVVKLLCQEEDSARKPKIVSRREGFRMKTTLTGTRWV